MSASNLRIPVLMYHKVGALLPDGSTDTFINVAPHKFEIHLKLMLRMGYRAVTFGQAVQALRGLITLPEKSFAVTFDDGYECVGEHAAPILARLSLPATVFVVSQAAGKANSWDIENNKPVLPLMSYHRLAELKASGWEVGGHTSAHPHLNLIAPGAALQSIADGKREVEAELGGCLETFCYPYGDYNSETPDLVRQAGFLGACTTQSGIAAASDNAYLLPRVKISYSDGAAGLLYKLKIRPHLPNMRKSRHA